MNKKKNIVILGGGQASAYAAKEIRQVDSNSNLKIISEENSLPYERPPLSKDCLLEKMKYEECLFFPIEFYKKNNIEVLCNEKVSKVDFVNNKIITVKKNEFNYNKLLIATGSTNRTLKVDGLNHSNEKGIIYLRNIHDNQSIKERLKKTNKILIIGGGFIGLEIASAASQLGKEVTIVEMGEQLMGRVIPKEIANLVQRVHEQNGNKFYLKTQIKKIIKVKNSYQAILDSNISLSADLIVIGIGSIPNVSIFSENTINIDNGIKTDQFSQTSIPNVFAAGDVANFYHPFYQMHMRLESYKHAQNHGINAGKNILGIKTSYKEIPWMWSDQFNLNIQLTGICNEYDKFVKRGSNVNEGIIYFFISNQRIKGACGVGIGGKIGRDIRLAGKLSEKNIKITDKILSDKSLKLNKLLS